MVVANFLALGTGVSEVKTAQLNAGSVTVVFPEITDAFPWPL